MNEILHHLAPSQASHFELRYVERFMRVPGMNDRLMRQLVAAAGPVHAETEALRLEILREVLRWSRS